MKLLSGQTKRNTQIKEKHDHFKKKKRRWIKLLRVRMQEFSFFADWQNLKVPFTRTDGTCWNCCS